METRGTARNKRQSQYEAVEMGVWGCVDIFGSPILIRLAAVPGVPPFMIFAIRDEAS